MEGVSKQELKQVGQLLLIIVLIMALGFWGFLQSPMYQAKVEQDRINAINYLINNRMVPEDKKQEIMDKYGLTIEDLTTDRLLEGTAKP